MIVHERGGYQMKTMVKLVSVFVLVLLGLGCSQGEIDTKLGADQENLSLQQVCALVDQELGIYSDGICEYPEGEWENNCNQWDPDCTMFFCRDLPGGECVEVYPDMSPEEACLFHGKVLYTGGDAACLTHGDPEDVVCCWLPETPKNCFELPGGECVEVGCEEDPVEACLAIGKVPSDEGLCTVIFDEDIWLSMVCCVDPEVPPVKDCYELPGGECVTVTCDSINPEDCLDVAQEACRAIEKELSEEGQCYTVYDPDDPDYVLMDFCCVGEEEEIGCFDWFGNPGICILPKEGQSDEDACHEYGDWYTPYHEATCDDPETPLCCIDLMVY